MFAAGFLINAIGFLILARLIPGLDVGGLLRFATPERREGLRDEAGASKHQPLAA